MRLIRDLADLPDRFRSGAVAIGNFDGVHLGHARIARQLIERARGVGGPSLVFTFDPHPVRLLRPHDAPPPLTWTDRKAALLFELGVDCVLAYPTDEALLQLSARDFFEQIVRARLDARALVEGPNFFFGHNREGNIDLLRRYAAEASIECEIVEPVYVDGEIVSSSRVRKLIAAGEVRMASQLLTRPYRIRGMVAHGAARGAKLGFPTANIEAIDTLLPAVGVYAGIAHLGGASHTAAINIGPNPTFGEHALKVEAHLLDWHDSIYGQPLELDFLARVREVRTFDGVDALKRQLQADIIETRRIVTEHQQEHSAKPTEAS